METNTNSLLGLGTAAIGRPEYINIDNKSAGPISSIEAFRQNGIAVLDAAYNQGVRYYDTAPGYGLAEKMIIDWVIQKEDPTIEVATKWGYTYVADFVPNATEHEVKEHSLAKLNEQWEASKALLPFLTTYQIHSATFESGVLDNESVLNRLAALKGETGMLIGITTTGSNQAQVLRKALSTKVNGIELFDAFQVTYNIFDQSLAGAAQELSLAGKRLIIKEALANGRIFSNKDYPHYAKAYTMLGQLAQKYKVGVDAIALRFCMDSIPTYAVLSGASNQQHLSGNLRTNDISLNDDEVEQLKSLAVNPADYWEERKKLSWH